MAAGVMDWLWSVEESIREIGWRAQGGGLG